MIPDDLKKAAKILGRARKADIFGYNAEVTSDAVDKLIGKARSLKTRQQRAILVLTTGGGSPDAGYRLARYFQSHYDYFIVLVLGYCKSAGTLIALGGTDIAMGDFGELGPLDVQVGK